MNDTLSCTKVIGLVIVDLHVHVIANQVSNLEVIYILMPRKRAIKILVIHLPLFHLTSGWLHCVAYTVSLMLAVGDRCLRKPIKS